MYHELRDMSAGGYRYIPAEFQYSSGVEALPGHRLVRVRFDKVVPLQAGFEHIKAYLQGIGRPLQSFAACELRSPKPFDVDGFSAFNKIYAGTLAEWGIMHGEDNPVARSNVCPLVDGPAEPGFYAFSYTEPASADEAPSFVIAGGAETRSDSKTWEETIIEYRNVSEEGVRKKGLFTMGEMESRLAAFGRTWGDTTAVQVYTVHDYHRLLVEEMAARGVAHSGLIWQLCRPPVLDVEFEMDCRAIAHEVVLKTG